MKRAFSYLRWSKPEQRFGDSERRQFQKTQEYCKANGLVLDETMTDHGISAFKGLNRIKGTLGKFIERVNAGEIPPGSILIVESLDRISRQEVAVALQQFLDLINKGITIHTLMDDMTYAPKKLAVPELMMSIFVMSRANEESTTKSVRIKESWKKRWDRVRNGETINGNMPSWIEVRDGKRFLIPEKVRVIKQIYKWRLEGLGPERIVKLLNAKSTPLFTTKGEKGWGNGFVNKLLRDRRLLGEFEIHSRVDGKRVTTGEIIQDYFPKVISEKDFFQVQQIIKRNDHGGKKKSNGCDNLFTSILFCHDCGSKIRHGYRDKNGKRYQYIFCEASKRGLCEYHSVNYYDFERNILLWLRDEVRPTDLSSTETEKELMDAINDQIAEIDGKLNTLNKRIERWIESIADSDKDSAFRKRIEANVNKAEAEIAQLTDQRKDLEASSKIRIHEIRDTTDNYDEMVNLINEMYGKGTIDAAMLRLKIRSKLVKVVEKITLNVDKNDWSCEVMFRSGKECSCQYFDATKSALRGDFDEDGEFIIQQIGMKGSFFFKDGEWVQKAKKKKS